MRDHATADEGALVAAAKKGDAEAAYRLAELAHDRGHRHEGRRWLNQAADLGHPEAMYRTAEPGPNGSLSKRDLAMMRAAAEAGHAGALYAMGRYYQYECYVPGGSGIDESGPWFQRAAEAGCREAMPIAGQLAAASGRAVDAIGWWRRIAATGDDGDWSWVNEPGVDAVARGAEAGRVDGLERFSVLTRRTTDDPRTLSVVLERAAKAGSRDAAFRFGELLRYYVDDTPEHRTTMRGFYQAAADGGIVLGLVRLGDLAPKNEEAAWYQRAADAGCPDGLARLGDLSADKDGAEVIWTRAAEMGSSDAMLRLSYLALERNYETGYRKWVRQAADAGNLAAMEHMSQPENDEGREWRRRLAAARPCKPRRVHQKPTGASLAKLLARALW